MGILKEGPRGEKRSRSPSEARSNAASRNPKVARPSDSCRGAAGKEEPIQSIKEHAKSKNQRMEKEKKSVPYRPHEDRQQDCTKNRKRKKDGKKQRYDTKKRNLGHPSSEKATRKKEEGDDRRPTDNCPKRASLNDVDPSIPLPPDGIYIGRSFGKHYKPVGWGNPFKTRKR